MPCKKSHPVLFRTKADVFAFIEQERATFGVTRLCRCYGVTRAGYYAWRQRPASRRQEQDRRLWRMIVTIFRASRGTYGSPRVHRALRTRRHWVSRRRVERLMRVGGLRGRVARIYRRKAGTHRWFDQHPNHVGWTRATGPNQIWVADLTYVRVGRRWWYLATVLDQYSRRVLAWRLSRVRDARLTGAVIRAALRRRRPALGLVFHNDRGSEFLGTAVRHGLAARGVRQSMTRGGAPDQNPTSNRSSIRARSTSFMDATSAPSATSGARCGGICRSTITAGCIPLWGINRPLTTNGEPRRTQVSTEPREDPSGPRDDEAAAAEVATLSS